MPTLIWRPSGVMGGNAILFISDRVGMRSHASWGSQNDVYIAFMNQETMDRFLLSKEELELLQAEEKLAADKKKAKINPQKKTNRQIKKLFLLILNALVSVSCGSHPCPPVLLRRP